MGPNRSQRHRGPPSSAASRALYGGGWSAIHWKMLGYKLAYIRVRADPTCIWPHMHCTKFSLPAARFATEGFSGPHNGCTVAAAPPGRSRHKRPFSSVSSPANKPGWCFGLSWWCKLAKGSMARKTKRWRNWNSTMTRRNKVTRVTKPEYRFGLSCFLPWPEPGFWNMVGYEPGLTAQPLSPRSFLGSPWRLLRWGEKQRILRMNPQQNEITTPSQQHRPVKIVTFVKNQHRKTLKTLFLFVEIEKRYRNTELAGG